MRSSARFPEIPVLRRSTSWPMSRATRVGPGSRCPCRPNPRWAGLADFAGLHRAFRHCSGRKPRIRASPRNSWSSKRRMVAEAQPALPGQRTMHGPRTPGQRSLHGRRRMAGDRNHQRWRAVVVFARLARPAECVYHVGTRWSRFQQHDRRRSDGTVPADVVFRWWIQLGGRRPSPATRSGCRSRERPGVAADPARWTAAPGRLSLVSLGLRCDSLVFRCRGAPDFQWRMVGEPPVDRRSALLERSDGGRGGGRDASKLSDQRRALLSGHSCGNLSRGMVRFWPGSEPSRP